ncbi:MAG: YkyA family protein [Cetobacterium sp.]
MVKVSIAFGLGMIASLYGNYVLRKGIKGITEIAKKDSKEYEKKIDDLDEILEKKDEIIKKQENGLKEYRKTNESLKNMLEDKQEECVELKTSYELEKETREKYFNKYHEFFEKYNTQLNNNEVLFEDFKKKEIELYNLDWAYDELMKAYNSNVLDLYFWNLLPKADRETRRRFINKGQYKVYSLEDGRLAFEVI